VSDIEFLTCNLKTRQYETIKLKKSKNNQIKRDESEDFINEKSNTSKLPKIDEVN